ncbi:MAG TPA: hypothetical protein VFC65_00620 [Prolixibacteraceae bacterium]|nr:hypothetical protein [Prolixibacteraceae bacterium]
MNKLDKQFEEMLKGVRIDSPSSDFMLHVMNRIQAEAVVEKHSLLKNYQPMINKKTWIILIVAFVLLMIYLAVSGKETATDSNLGLWSVASDSLSKIARSEVLSVWNKALGIFTSIPPLAYLIIVASLTLWTLDSFLIRFRQTSSSIQVN